MAGSFEFVKGLINSERYKDYKKDEWGGCDLVIVSNEKYEARKEFYDKWGTKGCHTLIHHDFAKSIIWLIETLKPYVDYDYITKYDYYENIAIFITTLDETEKDERLFLLSIVHYLENQKKEKNLIESYIDRNNIMTWYNFGIEHNDPFFVKFVALWMAFNKEYISYKGVYEYFDKRLQKSIIRKDVEFAKINEFCDDYKNSIKLESVHEKVFNSYLIKIFMKEPIQDMKQKDERKVDNNSPSDKNYNDLIKSTGITQTKALLQTIYRVRCNLLHGSKSPKIDRDIELVRCSGEIMEIYMKAIMEK